jgi:hypothetical protein
MKRLSERIPTALLILGIFVSILPIWSLKIFPTFDGPVFCSNLEILKSLLQGDPQTASSYNINHYPVPNWTSQFFGTFLSFSSDTRIAEKIIQSLCIGLLPLSFFCWLRKWQLPEYWVLAILPLSWNSAFCLGFYNFLLALSFLIFSMAWWPHLAIRKSKNIWAFTIIGLLYFTHPTAMCLMVLFIQAYQFAKAPRNFIAIQNFKLLLAQTPWLLLLVGLILRRDESGQQRGLDATQIIADFFHGRHLVFYGMKEEQYTMWLVVVPFVCSGIGCVCAIWRLMRKKRNAIRLLTHSEHPNTSVIQRWAFLFFFLSVLLMVFLLPNEDGWAGYVTMRLSLIFHLSVMMAIALFYLPKLFLWSAIFSMLLSHGFLLQLRWSDQTNLANIADEIVLCAHQAPQGSSMLTWNASDNWFLSNAGSYAALAEVQLINNPSASTKYFPVCYNAKMFSYSLRDQELFGCYVFPKINAIGKLPDQILVIGKFKEGNTCDSLIQKLTQIGYYLPETQHFVNLYSRRAE